MLTASELLASRSVPLLDAKNLGRVAYFVRFLVNFEVFFTTRLVLFFLVIGPP